jgi:hypothetical protein
MEVSGGLIVEAITNCPAIPSIEISQNEKSSLAADGRRLS